MVTNTAQSSISWKQTNMLGKLLLMHVPPQSMATMIATASMVDSAPKALLRTGTTKVSTTMDQEASTLSTLRRSSITRLSLLRTVVDNLHLSHRLGLREIKLSQEDAQTQATIE